MRQRRALNRALIGALVTLTVSGNSALAVDNAHATTNPFGFTNGNSGTFNPLGTGTTSPGGTTTPFPGGTTTTGPGGTTGTSPFQPGTTTTSLGGKSSGFIAAGGGASIANFTFFNNVSTFNNFANPGGGSNSANLATAANIAALSALTGTAILGSPAISPNDKNTGTLTPDALLHNAPSADNASVVINPNADAVSRVLASLPANPPDGTDAADARLFDRLSENLDPGASASPSAVRVATLAATKVDHATEGSRVKLTVQHDPKAGSDLTLMYLDPATNQLVQVQAPMEVDTATGTVEYSLGPTTLPSTSSLTGSNPQPLLIASLPDQNTQSGASSDYLAMANDSTLLPGYLSREVKHNEVFVINKLASGFYYAHEPSILSQGTLASGVVTVCDNGGLVSERENSITVLNGRSLFLVGNDPFMMNAPGASVEIPADAAAVVEYSKQTSCARISMVSGAQNGAATINTSIGRPIYLKAGKTISIYKELPVLKRLKLVASSGAEVPMKAMISRIDNFNVADMPRENGEKFVKIVSRVAEQSVVDADRVVHGGFALSAPVRLFASDKTIFSLEKAVVNLQIGDLFMHTAGQMTLKTDVADVKARPQSDFSVSYQPGRTRVDVLSGPGMVTLSVNGKSCLLAPGQEVVASTQALNQDLVFPQDGIARRCFNTSKTANTNLAVCEFAIGTMLKNSNYLKSLRQPQNSIDGLLRARLLKTACVVNFVGSSRGQYFAR